MSVVKKIKSALINHRVHESLDTIKSRTRKLVDDLLLPDEEFVMAVDCSDEGNVLLDMSTILVLTDQRLIAAKQESITRSWSETYDLDNITNVDFKSGMASAEITLRGSGIDESYEVYRQHGEVFVSELRSAL